MKKTVLNFEDVKDDILSPGRVLWQQKSGAEVLISGKGSFLNLEMIKKLINAGHVVMIEVDGEIVAHYEFAEAFKKYAAEIQVKDKLKWRNQIVVLMAKYYLHDPRDQQDMNMVAWKMFSLIAHDEAREYLDRDIHYFKRSMSVASSITISAFMLGYYDTKFLKNLFSSTMRNQMTLGKDLSVNMLKDELNSLRKKASLDKKDHAFVKTIVDQSNFSQKLLLEKFDGSGLMNFSTNDLNDLEILLCSLNYYFNWEEHAGKNILYEIVEGKFKTNVNIVNLIKRNFEVMGEKAATAA